jgi:hypothetical protein
LVGSQKLVKQFKAQKTPHSYVTWKVQGKWQITYDGDLDYNVANPYQEKRICGISSCRAVVNGSPFYLGLDKSNKKAFHKWKGFFYFRRM